MNNLALWLLCGSFKLHVFEAMATTVNAVFQCVFLIEKLVE